MKSLTEMSGSDFHIIAHIAYLVAMLEDKHEDANVVRKIAYGAYENRKQTGKLGL